MVDGKATGAECERVASPSLAGVIMGESEREMVEPSNVVISSVASSSSVEALRP